MIYVQESQGVSSHPAYLEIQYICCVSADVIQLNYTYNYRF